MEPNRIENILQQKLRDFSMETVPQDWTAIQRSAGLTPRRTIPLRRYAAVAASMALLVACGFLFLKRPDSVTINPLTESERLPLLELPHTQYDKDENSAIAVIARLKEAIDQSAGRQSIGTIEQTLASDPILSDYSPADEAAATDGNGQTAYRASGSGNSEPNTQPSSSGQRTERYAQAGNTFYPNSNDRIYQHARSTVNNWQLALFADGVSGSGSSATPKGGMDYLMQNSPSAALNEFVMSSDNILRVEQSEWDHRMPLTFGLSVRKTLGEKWGVEAGLSYSYLSSKSALSTGNSSYNLKQQLHYLGVPVAVTFTPFRTSNLEFYGRLGGAVDFNIAGRQQRLSNLNGKDAYDSRPETFRFTTSTPQWSASANIGIMYNITPVIGIYLEPGVSHYFESDDQPESYWKKHPTNFNMKIGVRTTF